MKVDDKVVDTEMGEPVVGVIVAKQDGLFEVVYNNYGEEFSDSCDVNDNTLRLATPEEVKKADEMVEMQELVDKIQDDMEAYWHKLQLSTLNRIYELVQKEIGSYKL